VGSSSIIIFGLVMRATVEDSELASMMGINVEKVNAIAWFLTGGLAGMAGSLMPLWFLGNPAVGGLLITSVFAGSILGGISSIYGAIIGGYIDGLSETIGVVMLSSILGPWVSAYRLLIPLVILSMVLMIFPRGITGFIEDWLDKRILAKMGEGK